MNKIKRAVIYTRFSSNNQSVESTETQLESCRDYCIKNGYMVTATYSDEAKTGTKIAGREHYQEMLDDSKEDKFDVVVMYKIDRNARDNIDYFDTKKKLLSNDVTLEYATQRIDDSAEGEFTEAILVGQAAYYSRNLSNVTRAGLRHKAQAGRFCGGNVLFGYTVKKKDKNRHKDDQDPDVGIYKINEEEAVIVRKIFELYIAGNGYGTIIDELTKAGYKTRYGNNFSRSTLFDILHNESYTGTMFYGKTKRSKFKSRSVHSEPADDMMRVEGVIPPLVSHEDFQRVLERTRRNKKITGSYRTREPYLLAGYIKCGICGRAMNGHRIRKNGKLYVNYECRTKGCNHSEDARKLEQKICSIIQSIISSETNKKTVTRLVMSYIKKESVNTDRIDELKKFIAEKNKQLKNIETAIINGAVSKSLIEQSNSISLLINEKEKELEKIKSLAEISVSQQEIENAFDELKQKIADVNIDDFKKELLELFLVDVKINSEDIQLKFLINNGFQYGWCRGPESNRYGYL